MNMLKTSFVGGLCLSSVHLFWVIIVAAGWAQPLMDFIFKLHMLNSPFEVQPFNLTFAYQLIGITFLIGFFYGALFYIFKNQFFRN